MKHILISGLLLTAFMPVSSFAQGYDDIYYTADDAKRDADKAEKERAKRAAARKSSQSSQSSSNSNTYTSSGNDYDGAGDEYIDYDDDDYTYANRFNRFNGPYYGGSYWAYDPFWNSPWYGPAWGYGWGFQPGFSVGFGQPYWSSYWGYNCWGGYGRFYNGWNRPWGWGGNPGWGWGGAGYYNGFYDGYYAGVYNNAGIVRNTRSYGPRSSLNRYPGSLRSSNATRAGNGQLRTGGAYPSTGARRRTTSSAGSVAPRDRSGYINRSRSGNATQRRSYNTQQTPARTQPSYNRGNSTPARSYSPSRSTPSRSAPSRSYSSPSRSSRGGFSGGSRRR